MNLFYKFILTGSLLILSLGACSQNSPKLIPAESKEDLIAKQQGSINTAVLNPMWDILFVIDDSGSMGSAQENLAYNVHKFTEAIYKNQLIDFHIGVITTTGLENPASYYGGPMGTVTTTVPKNCCGRLVGETKFVTRDTVNGIDILATNLIVGTNGSGSEAFFDPIYMALDQNGPVASYSNTGFYRSEAMLAIIFVTDTDDQSRMVDPYSMSQFLLKLKGEDKNKIFLAAANVSDADYDKKLCAGEGDQIPTNSRLADFFELMGGGSMFSLCDFNFGLKLAKLGVDISQRAQTMYLGQVPQLGSIHVTIGGQEVPQDPLTGWSYDPVKVAIRFGLGIEWSKYPPNSLPEVSFSILKQEPKIK